MAGYGLVVRFRARPGEGARLEQVLRELDARLRAAPGCEFHVVSRALGDPDEFWVTERFRDRASHAAALADPRVQALAGELRALLGGEPLRVETDPL